MKSKRDRSKDPFNPSIHSIALFLPDIVQTVHTSKYAPNLLHKETIGARKGRYVSFAAKIYQAYPHSHQFQKLNLQLQVSRKIKCKQKKSQGIS